MAGVFSRMAGSVSRLPGGTLIAALAASLWLAGATAAGAATVSGTVFYDADGTAAASGTGVSGVTVRLFNSAGTFVTSTTTNASGAYTFSGVADSSTFYVQSNAPFHSSTGNQFEQTYASAGTGNDGTAGGAGYGPVCVGAASGTGPVTYTQRSEATPSSWTAGAQNGASAGPCYGGRRGATVDGRSSTLTSDEHVTRIATPAGGSVTGVDFGFGNVVTNTNAGGQGSITLFVYLASNSASAGKEMRFVPTVDSNASGGGRYWWLVDAVSNNMYIQADGITIDGTAYSNADGTVLDTAPGNVAEAQSVGAPGSGDEGTTGAVAAPELEVYRSNTSGQTLTSLPIFIVRASDTTLKNLSMTGGTEGVLFDTSNKTNFTIENNLIGVDPSGADKLAVNSSVASLNGVGINFGTTSAGGCTTLSGNRGQVRNNYIKAQAMGIALCRIQSLSLGDLTFEGNWIEMAGGYGAIYQRGTTGTDNLTVINNMLSGTSSYVIYFSRASGNLIAGNTIPGSFSYGVQLSDSTSSGNSVQGNYVTGGTYGIYSTSTTGGVYSANLISGASNAGMYFTSASATNTVTGNTITGNTGGGLNYENSSGSVTGNTITGNTGAGVKLGNASSGNTISGNTITGNGGDGIEVPAQTTTTTNTFSQNIFGGNGGNAIDLNADGVTTTAVSSGSNCPSSGNAQGGIPRPRINKASLSGDTLTVSGWNCNTGGPHTIEIYVAEADADGSDTGSDGSDAGEPTVYLGSIVVASGGSFSGTIDVAGKGLTSTTVYAALDTNNAGSTSESSVNFRGGISGTVFLNEDGTAASSGTAIANVTVRLYNSSGTLLTSATTDSNGDYSFPLADSGGTYYVRVQRPGSTVLAEQTYASAGTGNEGSAGGAGYGPICVSAASGTGPVTYAQRSGTTIANWVAGAQNGASAGPCYGGRQGDVADSTSSTLTNGEHVTRVERPSIGSVSGVDFGFSYNVVTNMNTSGQGSLPQFLTNANNSASTTAVMRFVPTVDTNGAGNWWKFTPSSSLTSITRAGTTIDGTAYNNADGTTELDTMSGNVVEATSVGVAGSGDEGTAAAVAAPELEVYRSGTSGTAQTGAPVFTVAGNNVTLRRMSITGGTEGVWMNTSSRTGLVVEENAFGVTPDGTAQLAVTSTTYGGVGLVFGANSSCGAITGMKGTVRNNYIRASGKGVQFCNLTGLSSGSSWTVEGNTIHITTASNSYGVYVLSDGGSDYLTISRNMITGGVKGLYVRSGTGDVIAGNRIEGMTTGIEVNWSSTANASMTVRGNYLTGTTTGIYTSNAYGGTYSANEIYPTNTGMNFQTSTTSGGSTVTGNTIGAGSTGIIVAGKNYTITSNTITGVSGTGLNLSVGVLGGSHTVTGNTITGNGGVGISVSNSTVNTGNKFSQNLFGGNGGNAIDLNANGITTTTATGSNCPSSGNSQSGRPRPAITYLTVSGDTVTLSGTLCNTGGPYTMELYAAEADTDGSDEGSDGKEAGEGTVYLGSFTVASGGTFTNETVDVTGKALTGSFTLLATDSTNSTSEFSANFDGKISGVVYEDEDGTAASSGTGLGSVTVRLFDSAGALVETLTTGVNGAYMFSDAAILPSATYYVQVNRPENGAGVAEQTYASAGTGNSGSAGGTGYGPVCVGAASGSGPVTYTQRSEATPSSWVAGAQNGTSTGPCYGGRQGATADGSTSSATLTDHEHVTRVTLPATGSVKNVNFGFSYNVVTNMNTSGQGSLPQFIDSANASASTAAVMRFVPTVDTNGAGNWWHVDMASDAVVAISRADTTIDGTAYKNADGTVLDTMPGNIVEAAAVGAPDTDDEDMTAAVAAPELQVSRATSGTPASRPVFRVSASGVTLKKLSITGGSDAVLMNTSSATGLVVEENLIGVTPAGVDGLAYAGSSGATTGINIGQTSGAGTCTGAAGTSGTVRNNYVKVYRGKGVYFCGLTGLSLGDWIVDGNTIDITGGTNTSKYGVQSSGSNYLTVTRNMMDEEGYYGIHLNGGTGHVIAGNTIRKLNTGIYLLGAPSEVTVRGNVISDMADIGIRVTHALNSIFSLNEISNAGTYGMRFEDSGAYPVTVTGNTITGSGSDGIYSVPQSSIFTSNTVTGSVGRGMYISGYGTTLTSNTVADNGGVGVEIASYNMILTSNTITGSGDAGVKISTSSNASNILTSNTITGNTGPGVTVVIGSGNEISQNIFGSNGGSAIDLNNDGVTVTTATGGNCPSSGAVNGGIPRPEIADAVLSGDVLTLSGTYCADGRTHRLEFYRSDPGTGDTGSDDMSAGEGIVYLGALTGLSGGTFTEVALDVTGKGLLESHFITVLDIADDGNTSEFAANFGGPRVIVRIEEIATNGTGVFSFSMPDLLPNTVDVTVVSAGVPVTSGDIYGEADIEISIIQTGMPDGWDITPVSAVCVDAEAATTGNPASFGLLNGNKLTIAAANMIQGAEITCSFTNSFTSFAIAGTVFRDTGAPNPLGSGANTGTPNDGLQNGDEVGAAGVSLALTDCASVEYSTAVSGGTGAYLLSIPDALSSAGGNVCVQAATPAGYVATGANVSETLLTDGGSLSVGGVSYAYTRASRRIAFALPEDSSLSGINFAEVNDGALLEDGRKSAKSGGVAIHTHRFTAGSGGAISFDLDVSSGSESGPWSASLYEDTDCNASLSAADTAISGTVSLVEGQELCLLVKVEAPSGAPEGLESKTTLTANFTFTNASPALTGQYSRFDLTTVGEVLLSLLKEVRNVTTSGAFAVSSQAGRGDTLEYRITYSNTGPKPLTELMVDDATPDYTIYVGSSATCGALPDGLTSCSVAAQPANGETGALQWVFDGQLNPSEAGFVTYQVTVQ